MLCAKLVWLNHPIDPATGKPKTDKLNPDPAKRDRPLIGLEVVHALAPNGPNTWSGLIYNADDGHTYKAKLGSKPKASPKVKGCVLAVLCKRTRGRALIDRQPYTTHPREMRGTQPPKQIARLIALACARAAD